jgi:hypothetical protein
MLLGCALLLGCFFTAENVPYRAIYFLFVLPMLPQLWREAASVAARRRLKLLTGAILFLMWSPFFRLALEQNVARFDLGTSYSTAYVFLRETVWWWVASMLLALVFDLLIAARATAHFFPFVSASISASTSSTTRCVSSAAGKPQ